MTNGDRDMHRRAILRRTETSARWGSFRRSKDRAATSCGLRSARITWFALACICGCFEPRNPEPGTPSAESTSATEELTTQGSGATNVASTNTTTAPQDAEASSDISGETHLCGDGIRTGDEECDDANLSNTDACLNTCVVATCGDGHTRATHEHCDDGNTVNDDSCRNDCIFAFCGDAVVYEEREQCDDGNNINDDECRNNCFLPSCGDAIRDPQEDCDDGNSDDSDACTNECRAAQCGDGNVYADEEECDEGERNAEDAACLISCMRSRCGDGRIRAGIEQCDDGNTTDFDGCSSSCIEETRCYSITWEFCPSGIHYYCVATASNPSTIAAAACSVCAGETCREESRECMGGSYEGFVFGETTSATCSQSFVFSGEATCSTPGLEHLIGPGVIARSCPNGTSDAGMFWD